MIIDEWSNFTREHWEYLKERMKMTETDKTVNDTPVTEPANDTPVEATDGKPVDDMDEIAEEEMEDVETTK